MPDEPVIVYRDIHYYHHSRDTNVQVTSLSLLDEGQKKTRSRTTRGERLDQAVRAARHFLVGDPPRWPTKQDIADYIADEDGNDIPLATLNSHWNRDRRRLGEKPITMPEVLAVARKVCIS